MHPASTAAIQFGPSRTEMVHVGAEVWIDRARAIEVTGWHKKHLEKLDREGRMVSRSTVKTVANGKPQREYLLSSLPKAAQLKYAQRATQIEQRPEAGSLPLFAGNPEALAPHRGGVPEHLEPQVRARYDAIEPLLRWDGKSSFITRGGQKIGNTNDLAAYVAAQQTPAVSVRTVWRWLGLFKEAMAEGRDPWAALADRPRSDRNRSRFFAEHEDIALFVQHKCLGEGIRNAALLHEIIGREFPKRIPSYATVAAYLKAEIPLPLKTLAHTGREALLAKRLPFIQRKRPAPMEWWIADHRVFDVRVVNTLFGNTHNLEPGQPFRMWITAIYDWGSDYLVGYCFSPGPSSHTINSALRMAITRFGFPKNFYWDNGKDFKAVGERLVSARDAMNEEIRLTSAGEALLTGAEISFGVTHALPKRPRSKPIEALFTRWSKRFDILFGTAYVGNRTHVRSEWAGEADRAHQKFLDGKRADSPLPGDRAFIVAADQWIHEFNTQAHIEALDGRAPEEVMDAAYPPEARTAPPRRLLDALLLKGDERTVLAGGCVEICKMRYEPKAESMGALFLRQGKRVRILRDPYDFSEAVAVDPETMQFIGELGLQLPIEQQPHGRGTEANHQLLQTNLRNQRALARSCKNHLDAVRAGASIYGWQTEVQGLLSRSAQRLANGEILPEQIKAAAPGANASAPPTIAAPRPAPSSPFVDDSARRVLALMDEEEEGSR